VHGSLHFLEKEIIAAIYIPSGRYVKYFFSFFLSNPDISRREFAQTDSPLSGRCLAQVMKL